MPDLNNLPALLWRLLPEVRATGNLTQVAARIGVSQPAISKTLAKCETQLGVDLVRRDQRPVKLTQEGEVLADYAQQRLGMEALLERRLKVIRQQGAGLVRIASFGASSSTRILPPVLKHLRARFPQVDIELVELTDQEARRALKDGLVDFATLAGSGDLDFDYVPLAEDRLVCLLPEGHRLAGKGPVSPQDLMAEDFIMTKGGSEPLVRDWFRQSGGEPNVRHTALQLTSILALVRAGFGVSVIAEMAVPESHPEVQVAQLAPLKQREIFLCRRDGSFASHAAASVWDALSHIH
ncbi:Hca operon transcriptional activator [Tritonibacter multivorans]|uniref:Hca operon transcriptional activator n=1 Tax=Tritonibacter multivorans TaxID=928856 RepID=A0A0P1GAN3_9RHOB|nr:LysR family transcriptional regulator [Tritonibacter multivorans]MDA7422095.1 LysR family transcriptional regulator [Tritonibacter multivorans]CUH78479.1 Hca operon transcriptional activator [Tritonibacter multivorans]SFD17455.1 DNA-binding transcriptional regulator, LysR family [Tritonibacter multivorans]